MRSGRSGPAVRRGFVALCLAVLVSGGCARFNDAQSQPFTTNPELKPQQSSPPPPPPPLPATPFP
ncbi:MAG: sorbosone dehydrogenase family protein, partial [Mycobacterium sp.]